MHSHTFIVTLSPENTAEVLLSPTLVAMKDSSSGDLETTLGCENREVAQDVHMAGLFLNCVVESKNLLDQPAVAATSPPTGSPDSGDISDTESFYSATSETSLVD